MTFYIYLPTFLFLKNKTKCIITLFSSLLFPRESSPAKMMCLEGAANGNFCNKHYVHHYNSDKIVSCHE